MTERDAFAAMLDRAGVFYRSFPNHPPDVEGKSFCIGDYGDTPALISDNGSALFQFDSSGSLVRVELSHDGDAGDE
jgi:hypothetical protein